MKRIVTAILTMALLWGMSATALAVDIETGEPVPPISDPAPPVTEQEPEQGAENELPAAPAPITTLDELQAAVAAAEAGSTITIANTIAVDNATLTTDKELTICGAEDFADPQLLTVSNGATVDGFTFSDDKTLAAITVSNSENAVFIQNCDFATYECINILGSTTGGINTVRVDSCHFEGAENRAISIKKDTDVLVTGCVFSGNSADAPGGAISNSGKLFIENTTISGNTAVSGGGVYNTGELVIFLSTIEDNTAVNDMGADIFSMGGVLSIIDEGQAGKAFYEETTGEKLSVPFQDYAADVKLVYLTDEEAAVMFPPPALDSEPEPTPTPEPAPEPTPTPTPEPEPEPEPTPEPEQEPEDYTPPARPSRPRPSRPVTPAEPEPTPKPEPTPVFACGDAVIDVSLSVVLQGYGDGKLHLEDYLTRAQMATIIYRLLDEATLARYGTEECTFRDVSPNSWCSRPISTIANAGIVVGVGDGSYNPDGRLTWAHILTVLTRFVPQETCTLQAIQYSGWALDAVQTAVVLGWIKDTADFNPNAPITRGEFVQLVNGVLALYQVI